MRLVAVYTSCCCVHLLLLCAPALTGRNGVDCTCYNPRTLGGYNTQGKTRLVPGRSMKLQRGISMHLQYVSVSISVSVWHVYLRVCAHACCPHCNVYTMFVRTYVCVPQSCLLRRWPDGFYEINLKPKSASSILQALSCRFVGCILLVFVFHAFKICSCFVQFQKPPRDFSKQCRAHFRQRQAHGLLTRQSIGKKTQAFCTSEAIPDFHFLEITSLLGLLNCNQQNRQDRACRIELADLGVKILS